MSASLDAARFAVSRGWRPFPLDHPSLPRCIGLHTTRPCDGQRGKHPPLKWGAFTATEPPDALLRQAFNGKARNIGIACGPSELVVIDEDVLDALTALAAELGQELPYTYRVRTARGWHYYFAADPDRPLGNRTGGLTQHHCDVRGGRGAGGYVVAAGSLHESGHIYEAEDYDAPTAPIPGWLVDVINGPRTTATAGRLKNARFSSYEPGVWDDDPRTGSAATFRAQYQRHLDAVQDRGGEFRYQLYLAALDGWRLVDCGLLSEDRMQADMELVIRRVWGGEPDENDAHIVAVEAREKASRSPWRVVEEAGSDGEPLTAYQVAYDKELARQRLVRDVKAALAAERVRPLRKLTGAAFFDAPQPTPLVPGMLYQDSLAVVYGAPGGGKSLVVLGLALCLATGRRWGQRQVELPRTAVHYVMAEGGPVNVSRANAWRAHYHVGRDECELFHAIPQAITLTADGIDQYRREVEADRPALIVLDTKNAMMEGSESDPQHVAEMVRAMQILRDVCGSCVLLVDHTGVSGARRTRGSGALPAAVDTTHFVEVDKDTNIVDMWCDRDKAGETGAHDAFHMVSVANSVVLVPGSGVDRRVAPFGSADGWWRHEPELVPDELATLAGRGQGAARDVFRALRYISDSDGLTVAQIKAVLREAHAPRAHAESTILAAVALLKDKGVLVTGATPSRWALSEVYAESVEQCSVGATAEQHLFEQHETTQSI